MGADDGMLHAFFTEDTTIGSTSYEAGSEAFAFIPKDMLQHITQLFVQGGQSPDPDRHLFGLASSPKAKDLCVKSCADKDDAEWATLMAMPEGFGGNRSFYLDVSEPANDLGIADPPMKVMWQTDQVFDSGKYDTALGLTMSLPAFLYNMTDARDDYRVIFASGYQTDPLKGEQGRRLVVAKAWTGAVVDTQLVASPAACSLPKLPTPAHRRGHGARLPQGPADEEPGHLLRRRRGTLWRYSTGGKIHLTAPSAAPPCTSRRGDPARRQRRRRAGRGSVHLAGDQLLARSRHAGLGGAVQIVIMKDQADAAGTMTKSAVDIRLTAGKDICAILDDKGTCTLPLPKEARPAGTPTALLRSDASGFALFAVGACTRGCGKGTSYMVVHEIKNEAVTQKYGLVAANEPVMGAVFAGGQISWSPRRAW